MEVGSHNLQDRCPYSAELEWIESTGWQSICTDVRLTRDGSTYKAQHKLKFYPTTETQYIGVDGFFFAGYAPATNALVSWSSVKSFGDYDIAEKQYKTDTSHATDYWYRLFNITSWNKTADDGGRLGGYWCVMRLYWSKLWKNDQLVLDMIPVDVGGKAALYDKVSGKCFFNEGTKEDFIMGPYVRI